MTKILLVEDDKNARELYSEILTSAGYTVETASDGETGLNLILNEEYPLIFLDVMLPKMDGLSVLSSLKKNNPQKVSASKIVILSNLTHSPVINEALSLGAYDHISKPSLSPEEFIAKVEEFLS